MYIHVHTHTQVFNLTCQLAADWIIMISQVIHLIILKIK